jgi:hypothetical protein
VQTTLQRERYLPPLRAEPLTEEEGTGFDRMHIKIFVGEGTSAREAAAKAEKQANTFLSANKISWQDAQGQHTNAYAVSQEKSGASLHSFMLTLLIEEKATRFL